MKTQLTTDGKTVSALTPEQARKAEQRSSPMAYNQFRIELPGPIARVDDDRHGFVIELGMCDTSIIDEKAFDAITRGMSIEAREELYTKVSRQAMIELMRATLTIR